MNTIWRETVNNMITDEKKTLSTARKPEVIVIGAGMAGILIAHRLKEKGVDVIILEANKIASGQTMGTTAKITSLHGVKYQKLIYELGIEKAKQYSDANEKAMKDYEKLIKKYNISCNFEKKKAYAYSIDERKKIEQEVDALKKLGLQASFETDTYLPFPVKGAVCLSDQAQFHPIKFINHIAKELEIYEDTRALGIENGEVLTRQGRIKADAIVIAAHYPFINAPGYYFLRMYQDRSYVLALKGATQLDGMYIGVDKNPLSFRNYDDLLLLGGAGHRSGQKNKQSRYAALEQVKEKYYPESKIVTKWSAGDCMTIDSIPYIGRFSAKFSNIYVATGFQKWGMSTSMIAANIISDKIIGKKNPHAEVFTPQRLNLIASVQRGAKHVMKSGIGLSKEFLMPPKNQLKDIDNGHGGIIDFGGKKIGVYKDDNGEAYLVTTKCPHIGCQLEWNMDEKTWDCPCHGSRFDYKGHLLNNPALKGLKRVKRKGNR